MPGFKEYSGLLEKLGKHKTGRSCLYIKSLADVHVPTLKTLVRHSAKHMKKIVKERTKGDRRVAELKILSALQLRNDQLVNTSRPIMPDDQRRFNNNQSTLNAGAHGGSTKARRERLSFGRYLRDPLRLPMRASAFKCL